MSSRIGQFSIGADEYMVVSVPLAAEMDKLSSAKLSSAERNVVALITQGFTNQEIASSRGVSPRTVANQIASILHKTGAPSRAALAHLVAMSTKVG